MYLKPVLLRFLLAVIVTSTAATVGESREHRVPDVLVSSAYLMTRPEIVGNLADPVMVENDMRAFALSGPDDVVERNLAWVRQSDWQPQFKNLFERAVIWARAIRQRNPEELYRLSKEFRARPAAAEKHFESVAKTLRFLAARAGHEQAEREEAEWRRNWKQGWSPSDHARMMAKIAKGDPGAMYMFSYRYERAEGLARDLAKAYYWLLRARRRGGDWAEDVAIAVRNLDRRISPADKKRALTWFREGTVPEQ